MVKKTYIIKNNMILMYTYSRKLKKIPKIIEFEQIWTNLWSVKRKHDKDTFGGADVFQWIVLLICET